MSHYDQALIAVNPASKVLIGIQRVKTETGDSVDTHVYVYDPNALAWVPSQSASGGPSSDVNITNTSLAVTGTFWPTTAGAPSSVRLSDGSAFYAALKPADTLTKVATVDTITNPVTVTGTVAVSNGAAGTEYTEGDTDASITGTAMLWEDTSDTLRAVSAAKPLPTSVSAALPAGNNNIGDVDIASIAAGDNNIGNVDVVTLPALPAGTNNIGDVDVLTLPALPAGNNNIGDVDIASIAAGSNIIGNVRIDQTTPGTTNGVQVTAALPAGTNAIGKLAANSGVDIGDVDVTSVSGNVTVVQGTGSNLHTVLDSGTLTTVTTVTSVTAITNAVAVTNGDLTTMAARTPALGQAAMASSAPVVIASDQSAIPITGSISANSSADVLAPDGDAGYTVGATGQNLTQTSDGRLRVLAGAAVSDAPLSGLVDNDLAALSITTDGRLRVSSVAANLDMEFFHGGNDLVFGLPDLVDANSPWAVGTSSPWP